MFGWEGKFWQLFLQIIVPDIILRVDKCDLCLYVYVCVCVGVCVGVCVWGGEGGGREKGKIST